MVTHGRGELLLSICHHPVANRLTVVILKARGLPKMDITGLTGELVNSLNGRIMRLVSTPAVGTRNSRELVEKS